METQLQQFFAFILKILGIFPPWLSDVIVLVMGAVIIVKLVQHFIKTITSPEITKAALSIYRLGSTALKAVAVGAAEAVDSPIKHPRIARFFEILFIVNGYLMALSFLCLFVATTILIVAYANTEQSPWHKMGAILLDFVFLYFALAIKAYSDRDLVALRNKAKTTKNGEGKGTD